MHTDVITTAVSDENWSAYDEKKTAQGNDPAFFTGEPWEVRSLENLLQDARAYEGGRGVFLAVYLRCAEVKPPRRQEDFVRHVVEKIMA